MDPALRELITAGHPSDRVEAIIRLREGADEVPPGAREICRFGTIRTVRLARDEIVRVWSDPATASLKAARAVSLERRDSFAEALFGPWERPQKVARPRRPRGLSETGRGVLVGVVDWGFDFAHPAFRAGDGTSRIAALWDQRDPVLPASHRPPKPYGYGRVLRRAEITRALGQPDPYGALGYHPGDADTGRGAHGTHVADIAAGSPRSGGEGGMAPGAELICVHLAADRLSGLSDLGSSVRIIEAVDFINRMAGDRPCVINMSLGRQGGAKTGQSLVERALDAFSTSRDNACIVQSAGNYFLSGCHASGTLRPGGVRNLGWRIRDRDRTENEMEIWYSDRDRLRVTLTSPDGRLSASATLGETRNIRDAFGREVARIYNRAFEPNTKSHNCDLFMRKRAPGGTWTVRVEGDQIVDGRFDAWIERDGGRSTQSRFATSDVDTTVTIGSIASGFHPIAVGAATLRGRVLKPARFGSSGPTRDGRSKPDVVAPGVRVLAARSTPPEASAPAALSTRMSGASQAAPYVTGLVALCLEAGGGQLGLHDIRRAVVGSCDRPRDMSPQDILRLGAGIVNPRAAVRFARALARSRSHITSEETQT